MSAGGRTPPCWSASRPTADAAPRAAAARRGDRRADAVRLAHPAGRYYARPRLGRRAPSARTTSPRCARASASSACARRSSGSTRRTPGLLGGRPARRARGARGAAAGARRRRRWRTPPSRRAGDHRAPARAGRPGAARRAARSPQLGFGHPGTAAGEAGPAERDASRRRARPPASSTSCSERLRRRLTPGRRRGRERARGGRLHQPVGGVTEIIGVGTLPARAPPRRRRAVTGRLVQDARERGAELVFLAAGDDDVAPLYGRLGFERARHACFGASRVAEAVSARAAATPRCGARCPSAARSWPRPACAALAGALTIAFSAILVQQARRASRRRPAAIFRCAYALPVLGALALAGAAGASARARARQQRLALIAGHLLRRRPDLLARRDRRRRRRPGDGARQPAGGDRPVRRLGGPGRAHRARGSSLALPLVVLRRACSSPARSRPAPTASTRLRGVLFGVLDRAHLRRLHPRAAPRQRATCAARPARCSTRRPSPPSSASPPGSRSARPTSPRAGRAHAWLATLALTSQVLGWLLIAVSLPRLPAALTSVTLTIQPVGSVVLGVVLLGEEPTRAPARRRRAASSPALVSIARRRAPA